MKWLNYHHLIYFKEIARLGSLAKASETLGVGQPALSTQLKQLERFLEIDLFERKNRRLVLTEAGQIALDYADKISELGQEFLQVTQSRTFTKRIHLRVGAVDAIPKSLVSGLVDFAHKKTGCFLSIFEGDPSYLLRELGSHQLDVIVADQTFSSFTGVQLYSKQIVKSKVNAYAHGDFKNLRAGFPQSLDGKPAILPTVHSKLRGDLEHYFHLKRVYLDTIAETQDSMLQKILASKGDGIIFLPELAATGLVEEGKLVSLGNLQDVTVEYYVIYSRRMIENPAVELLINQNYRSLKLF